MVYPTAQPEGSDGEFTEYGFRLLQQDVRRLFQHIWSGSDRTDLTDGGDTTLHHHDSRYYTETESDGRYLQLTGGTMLGDINMGGYDITNAGNFYVAAGGATGIMGDARWVYATNSITAPVDEVRIQGGSLTVGQNDALNGTFALFGGGVAATSGGSIELYTARDYDDTFENYGIAVVGEDLLFRQGVNTRLTLRAATTDWLFSTNIAFVTTTATAGQITQDGSSVLHFYGTQNTFAGEGAGNFTLTGINNSGFGYLALSNLTSGDGNFGQGARALEGQTTANYGVAVGVWTCRIGNAAGRVGLGYKAGFQAGANSVHLGRESGYWDDDGDRFYVDNTTRADKATGRLEALMYGIFDTLPANQSVRINGALEVGITASQDIKIYHDSSDAQVSVGTGDFIVDVDVHSYSASADRELRAQTDKVDGQAQLRLLNDVQTWMVRCATTDKFTIRDATNSLNTVVIDPGADRSLVINGTEIVINEPGADIDFRVEGTGKANALVVQGSDGFVGINDGTPSYQLDIQGHMRSQDGYKTYFRNENTYIWSRVNTRLSFISSGSFEFGDQTSGNWQELESDGSPIYHGSAGMAHASIWVRGNTTQTAIAVAGTYVQFVGFANNGSAKNATPDHTNDHITIDEAGVYDVVCSITLESVGGGAADTISFELRKNNGATTFNEVHTHRKLAGGGGDIGAATMSGQITLAEDDTLEIWVANESNATNVLVSDCNLKILQIAGS
jgi:hypothetical protein